MSTVSNKVILLSVVFLINIVEFCKPLSKLDLPKPGWQGRNEPNGANKKSDTHYDSKPGPRLIAPMLYPLSYGVSWQILNFDPYKLQISNSFRRLLSFMWTFLSTCFVNSTFYECPQLILFYHTKLFHCLSFS